MSWPTAEQFDAASAAGTAYAEAEIANGATEAQESPLSGEWADAPSPRSISESLGFTQPEAEEEHHEWVDGMDEIANAWERGYRDVFAHREGAS